MAITNQESVLSEINSILSRMNQENGFTLSILADPEGFAVASSAGDGMDAESHSAVVGLVQNTANQVCNQLQMSRTDEISLYDADGQRLVCRPFKVGDTELILAVTIPDRKRNYRRSTNRSIVEIQHLWSQFWV